MKLCRFALFGLMLVLPVSASEISAPSSDIGRGTFGRQLVGVESPIVSGEYVLMPGDRVLVTVTGSVTYSYESPVTYEGRVLVSMPTALSPLRGDDSGLAGTAEIVDAVDISGLTIQQAQDTLSSVMRGYFRQAEVKLTLLALRSNIVFVTGEIRYPGAYSASAVERVSHLIDKAGGIEPLGSRSRIRIIRDGRLHAVADIGRFEAEGDLTANPFVASGDVIYVPVIEQFVTVKGAVFGREGTRPTTAEPTAESELTSEGIYEFRPGDRVSDIIRRAGGITPSADLANCYVDRLVMGGQGARRKLPVDLHAVMFDRDTGQNLALMNSDHVIIPSVKNLVYIQGEVQTPDAYRYAPGLNVGDYVGQAGGPTHYANIGKSHIIRDGHRLPVRDNPSVEAGDIIIMPRVRLRWWQDYAQIIGAVGVPVASMLISLIALSR